MEEQLDEVIALYHSAIAFIYTHLLLRREKNAIHD